jgi:hypothetical protein
MALDIEFENGRPKRYYQYTPSEVAAYLFVALFALTTIAHFIMIFPYQTKYFISLLIGGICKKEPCILATTAIDH